MEKAKDSEGRLSTPWPGYGVRFVAAHNLWMKKSVDQFIDVARWVSAWLVLVGHVRAFALVEAKNAGHLGPAIRALYLLTGLGHCAVVVFFVISGYLVGGITLTRWMSSGTDLLSYAIARFARIYTVLLPTLVTVAAMDAIGARWFNSFGLYSSATMAKYHLHVAMDSSITDMLGNAAMLQGISVNIFGTDAPLWSLAYEWWYYCLFALVAAAIIDRRPSLCVLALALTVALPIKIIAYGLLWIMGFAAFLFINKSGRRPTKLMSLPTFAAVLSLHRLYFSHFYSVSWQLFCDSVLGLAFIFLLWSFHGSELPGAKLHAKLANFSYSTYLLHFPVIVLLCSIGTHVGLLNLRTMPGEGVINILGITSITLGICFLFSRITEANTNAVRGAITRHIQSLSMSSPTRQRRP